MDIKKNDLTHTQITDIIDFCVSKRKKMIEYAKSYAVADLSTVEVIAKAYAYDDVITYIIKLLKKEGV